MIDDEDAKRIAKAHFRHDAQRKAYGCFGAVILIFAVAFWVLYMQ